MFGHPGFRLEFWLFPRFWCTQKLKPLRESCLVSDVDRSDRSVEVWLKAPHFGSLQLKFGENPAAARPAAKIQRSMSKWLVVKFG